MAKIFISHSSRNNDKAIEVRDWLAANGWTDVFLDLDPERGIVAGQRWKDALTQAAHRCEAVLALISPEWLASGWCKTEINTACMLGKKVIVGQIDKAEIPLELTDEQFIDLSADPQAYPRLKEGLKRAGLDPTSFPFDAGRRPYPGLACLEEQDAAVFFGRDAQIVRGLDEIRRLVRTGLTRMLVILGASGSGKSSFLRAGLWPRLKRDDRAWLPLPILRPERAAISGKYGLAEALRQIMSEERFAGGIRRRGLPQSRADIQDLLEKTDDGLEKLFAALRDIAQAAALSDENAAPPTILLALDQGEELFNEEGRDEARRFIEILTKTLSADHPHALAILAMRSDSFPLMQVDPRLAALPKDTFTLDMMLEGSYRAVIEGPARLVEPTPLKIDPQLTDALLKDISGQDALPLLAFTLAYLYEHYAADNALTLSGYDKIGRVTGVIDQTVAQAFAEAVARGEAPKDKEAQLELARSAFIPHLAQVNAAGQAVRRVTAREKIPAAARALIDRFADQRLLIKDRRKDAEGHEVDVVEVAHEALLRQPPFSRWLEDDREFLVWRERLSQARADFEDKQRGLLAGRELEIARSWMQTRAEHEIEPADQAFIRDSIAADDKRRAEEAAQQKRRQRLLVGALLVFAILAVCAGVAAIFGFWQKSQADKEKGRALIAERTAKEQQAKAEKQTGVALSEKKKASEAASQANVSLALNSRANGNDNQALAYLAKALRLNGENSEAGALTAALLTQESWPVVTCAMKHGGPVHSAQFSPDGQRVVTASTDGTARVWDAATGKALGEPMKHTDKVWTAQFSADGQRVVTASADGTARVWDLPTVTTKDSAEDVNLLIDLAEANADVAIQAFGQTETLATLTPDQVKATRDRIAVKFPGSLSTLTPLQRFLKWSVANPSTRPISPFSDVTVTDWVNNRIKEGTLDDLRAAMLVDPANPHLAAHFGTALVNLAVAEKTDPDEARRARAEADTQTQRAVELAPAGDEVKTLRADVVKRLQLGSESPVRPAPPGRAAPAASAQAAASPSPSDTELLAEAKRYLDAQDYAQALPLLQKAADVGNTDAMVNLGLLYENGWGVTQDYAQAREWYQKAADAGNANAKEALARLSSISSPTPASSSLPVSQASPSLSPSGTDWFTEAKRYLDAKDYSKALPPLQKAADAGDAEAMGNLAWLYRNGLGTKEDDARAREWYQKAAEAGNVNAMANLGWLYENGVGVTQDYAPAREWYQKAANAGNADAKEALARLSSISSPTPASSPLPVSQASPSPSRSGADWMAEAKRYLDAKDYAQALPPLQKAADAGNAEAANWLGWLYQYAWGVTQNYAQARQWYQKAAEAGNAVAMANLGYLYEQGWGVTQDYGQAREWYQKAAAADNAVAMDNLGLLYQNGRGVTQDYAQARQWYQKAAEAGNAVAMANLGLLYWRGWGGDQDYAQARAWFQKAAEAGNAEAKEALAWSSSISSPASPTAASVALATRDLTLPPAAAASPSPSPAEMPVPEGGPDATPRAAGRGQDGEAATPDNVSEGGSELRPKARGRHDHRPRPQPSPTFWQRLFGHKETQPGKPRP